MREVLFLVGFHARTSACCELYLIPKATSLLFLQKQCCRACKEVAYLAEWAYRMVSC
jgi:hypothetical protein